MVMIAIFLSLRDNSQVDANVYMCFLRTDHNAKKIPVIAGLETIYLEKCTDYSSKENVRS